MQELGRLLVIAGVLLAVVGGVLYLGPSVPLLGKLPGDIRIEGERGRFYFPIVTCLVLSVVLTLILNLVSRWR